MSIIKTVVVVVNSLEAIYTCLAPSTGNYDGAVVSGFFIVPTQPHTDDGRSARVKRRQSSRSYVKLYNRAGAHRKCVLQETVKPPIFPIARDFIG